MSGTIVAKIRFENASYQTYGELPKVGSRAPDVSLVNTKLHDVSLANWTGMRKIMNIVTTCRSRIGVSARSMTCRTSKGCLQSAMPDSGKTTACRSSTVRWRACSPAVSS